ncbi:MtrAB system histidine kinase MtrB [Naasia lichenicola]|uniref:Sensor histidine kinase MtrB n=1 Tax=Naasia lichenicola TaxID=2565933 RepID=A0A4S4FJW5_9MICO|nr:MtrAB system histidine kinase MtrB [Naasia lichenicola]THG30713.1 HAMP domain-containing histidine kinase [Naasia lichenicola]THG31950.1 HAMP domain-containing histidine kinase [Naasia lichenicola]
MTIPPSSAGLSRIPLGIRLSALTRLPRTVGSAIASAFRRSLEVRIVAITVALSAIALLATGTYMSYTIGNGLFQARVDQVRAESDRAVDAAQSLFDSTTAADGSALSVLQLQVLTQVESIATSNAGIALQRAPGTQVNFAVPNVSTRGTATLLSDELQDEVSTGQDDQYYQSVSIPAAGAPHPGLIVGSTVNVPTQGTYQLYLLYDLADVQQSLSFVQNTLLIGGLALIMLIAGVTWIVVQSVIAPIRVAAETSRKLAAGQLEERIPERGEDVIATLARSFNGMADSLQRQIVQLAGLSQVQQRFVSDVSHELRTPLTTIRLAGDVLYDNRGDFDPTSARTAELLHTQVERFESLLSDLLEISRYDARAADIELAPVNLVHLAEEAIATVETLADRKGSVVELVAPGGHFEAEMDARRIRRIVRNLLGNAIEHGEGKPITVTIDSNATAVAIAVRDHGIGMTRADADRVFDRFWRADPSRQRTTGGTGLGLAISLEDATLHAGWLNVWSAEGRGSCFRLTLPRSPRAPIESSPLPLPPDDAPHAPEDAR